MSKFVPPLLLLLFGTVAACATPMPPPAPDPVPVPEAEAPPAPEPWRSLFDGASLGAWEAVDWGIQGECRAEDGMLRVGGGESVSGVRWTGDLDAILPAAREEYELRLEARRESGFDFFCGLTFPVGREGAVTLICGGWAGGVLGLSCLDGGDASENDTTRTRYFENERWFAIRVRVTAARVECFIDDEPVIEVERNRYATFSVRAEMLEYQPLGLAAYQCEAAFRAIEVRDLTPE